MPFLQKCAKQFVHFCCRAPHGARGLKYIHAAHSGGIGRRAPRGARLFPERPLLVGDDFVLVGFKEAEWESRLKTQ